MGKVFTVNILNFVAIVWMFHFLFQFMPPLFIVFVVSDCWLPCWLSMHIMVPCKRFKTMYFFLFSFIPFKAQSFWSEHQQQQKKLPRSLKPHVLQFIIFFSFKTFYRSFIRCARFMHAMPRIWLNEKKKAHTIKRMSINVTTFHCIRVWLWIVFSSSDALPT